MKVICPKCAKVLIPSYELFSPDGVMRKYECALCRVDLCVTVPLDTDEQAHEPQLMYYLFSGGDGMFFVAIQRDRYDTDADALTAADEIAQQYADCPEYSGVFTLEEADDMGYDTV